MNDTHAIEAALIQAVARHDMPAVMRLVDDEPTMRLLQQSVLPWAETEDVHWFWKTVQKDTFLDLCRTMREACTGRLLTRGFTPGNGFSWGCEGDLPTLWVNGAAHALLIKTLPPERYSTARIILREESAA